MRPRTDTSACVRSAAVDIAAFFAGAFFTVVDDFGDDDCFDFCLAIARASA
jgi:hypothetical protein